MKTLRNIPKAYEVLNFATTGSPWSTLDPAESATNMDSDSVSSSPKALEDSVPDHGMLTKKACLTKAFLQSDELCATSTSIQPLLNTIWKYIPSAQASEMTSIEHAAGHYYWLPDGLLADEWVHFFQIAPDRFLDMAPPEVKKAYEDQVGDGSIIKASFGDVMREQAHKNSQHLVFEDMLPLLERVTGPGSSTAVGEPFLPTISPSSTSGVTLKKREYGLLDESSSVAIPKPKRARHQNVVTAGQSVSVVVDSSLTSSMSLGARNPQSEATNAAPFNIQATLHAAHAVPATAQPAPVAIAAPSNIQTTQTAHPVPAAAQLPMANAATAQLPLVNAARAQLPVVNAAPAVFPLLSSPTGAIAFIDNPAAPPHFIRQQRFLLNPSGAIIPTGNHDKAWHAQRLRAWVEIEGQQLHALPNIAWSPYGNEMSNLRTPASIDPRLCPFPTSIEENFTFFPNTCTINREMCIRAMAQWTPINIARYINYAHDVQTHGAVSRSRIAYHCIEAARFLSSHPGIVPTASLQGISTDSGLLRENGRLHDYFLYHMGDGVRYPPTGRQAQMLTRVIDHVRNVTQDRNVRLSQALAYAQRHGISVPASASIDFSNLAVADTPPTALLRMIKADYERKFPGLIM
ncbi:hypothetical protein PTT_12040 [Pyrenophora teres f. teres 0-1]|uniref:Uncharacterized protein n=1 Tax=Pyrenophora teres f. teres (strain 0-1) TaxID=861557 RepID=E3RSV2_PYRTT|nr:hypothetical protein PTT_12040 [Pyrenophora teres f. teres 0-1]